MLLFYITFILFFNYLRLQPFKSVHSENKIREVVNKESVTKISSMEFAVFGLAKPEMKISALKIIELYSQNELLYSYIQAFFDLSRTTNDHL